MGVTRRQRLSVGSSITWPLKKRGGAPQKWGNYLTDSQQVFEMNNNVTTVLSGTGLPIWEAVYLF